MIDWRENTPGTLCGYAGEYLIFAIIKEKDGYMILHNLPTVPTTNPKITSAIIASTDEAKIIAESAWSMWLENAGVKV